MKTLINTLRVLVGLLFTITGIVKLNDPLGYAFLLQDYFGHGGLYIGFIYNHALAVAGILTLIETILGVALILGYAIQLMKWVLLISTFSLTILILITAYSHNGENCNYLSSIVTLSPELSFWKFLGLFIIASIIFIKSYLIRPIYKLMLSKWILFITFILCLLVTYKSLMHLPFVDTSPYQKGTTIINKIDTTDTYKTTPWDFNIFLGNKDLTPTILEHENLILIVSYDLNNTEAEGWDNVKSLIKKVGKKDYKVLVLASATEEAIADFKDELNLTVDFAQIDREQAKRMIRSNPGLLLLKNGTIIKKKHWNDINHLKLRQK